VDELTRLAQEIGLPADDASARADAVRALLAPKATFEKEGLTRRQSTTVVDHFVSVSTVWDMRPVVDRETDTTIDYLSVLLVSMTWHDDAGNSERAVFQMTEDEWAGFLEAMSRVEVERRIVARDLEYLRGRP
jgi:hypothetical protein